MDALLIARFEGKRMRERGGLQEVGGCAPEERTWRATEKDEGSGARPTKTLVKRKLLQSVRLVIAVIQNVAHRLAATLISRI